jgi:hypothetical protein
MSLPAPADPSWKAGTSSGYSFGSYRWSLQARPALRPPTPPDGPNHRRLAAPSTGSAPRRCAGYPGGQLVPGNLR